MNFVRCACAQAWAGAANVRVSILHLCSKVLDLASELPKRASRTTLVGASCDFRARAAIVPRAYYAGLANLRFSRWRPYFACYTCAEKLRLSSPRCQIALRQLATRAGPATAYFARYTCALRAGAAKVYLAYYICADFLDFAAGAAKVHVLRIPQKLYCTVATFELDLLSSCFAYYACTGKSQLSSQTCHSVCNCRAGAATVKFVYYPCIGKL